MAGDILDRAQAVIDAGADLLLVDSSHGHAESVLEAIERLHGTFSQVELIGGNVATAEGAEALIKSHVLGRALRRGAGLDLHHAHHLGRGACPSSPP